jgi:acetyl esterase
MLLLLSYLCLLKQFKMKRIIFAFAIGIIIAAGMSSCGYTKLAVLGFSKKEVKELQYTAEPGTFLDPMAAVVVEVWTHPERNPIKDTARFIPKPPPMEWVKNETVPGETPVPVRIYKPKKTVAEYNIPVIVFYHGGGYIAGSVDEYDLFARKIARDSRCIVVSVEYRLAPEFPYPAAVNDCYAALEWVAENAEKWNGDPEKLVVSGESAGGGLATVMTLMAHDNGGPDIDLQMLWYPSTMVSDEVTDSRKYFTKMTGRDYLIPESYLRNVLERYVPDSTMWRSRYVSPVYAELTSQLPEALIYTCQCDPLRDEGRLYAERLSEAGVPVTYTEVEGMVHAFMIIGNVFPQAGDAFRRSGKFVRDYYGY